MEQRRERQREHALMSNRRSRLLRLAPPHLALLALAGAAALGACSKTDSAPTGFGVNVTVDATGVSSADRAKITTDKLTIVSDKPGATPVVRVLADLPKALAGGTVQFHYTPGPDVAAGDQLSFGLDVLNVTTLVASGSAGPVALAANAVSLTITLVGVGDGGINNDVVSDASAGEVVNPNGKANGVPCATDDECGTAFCTDGVCCNERCKADVCASCALPDTKGICTAYAAGSDPEMNCAAASAAPAPDLGSPDGGAAPADDASVDADNGDAAVINVPDGGFMTTANVCAGTCSGSRSCKYPGVTMSCGKPFCNSRSDVGAFVCDGNGGCAPALSTCDAYACDDTTGACRTVCAAHVECVATDYCSGSATCLPKKQNGVACTAGSGDNECVSGACSGGVCCNTACDGPGLTCTGTGHIGQCQCEGVTCAAGVACQIFYQDSDGDTFGNKDGTIGTLLVPSVTAKAGCAGSPPAGYVADNTDCDDKDPAAHPGQTAYSATPTLGKHDFDFNCNGAPEKETPEYVGGSCKYCGPVGTSCLPTTPTCTGASTGSFQCPQEGYVISRLPIAAATTAATAGLAAASETPLSEESALTLSARYLPAKEACCGCDTNDKTGFMATVACGTSGFTYTCTGCTGQGGNTVPATPTGKVQRCR
jgi:hypothetical protein